MPTEKIADQTFEEIPVAEEKLVEEKYLTFGKFKLKQKVVLLASGGLLILLILLLILVNLLKQLPISPKPSSLPTPTPTPFEEQISSPSVYATDSAVLEIEANLKTLDQDLQSTDLKEAGLNPPVLDMEVEFEGLTSGFLRHKIDW